MNNWHVKNRGEGYRIWQQITRQVKYDASDNRLNNLITLCSLCHMKLHKEKQMIETANTICVMKKVNVTHNIKPISFFYYDRDQFDAVFRNAKRIKKEM